MNIAFYFPYPSVGGVSILFLRLANYFSKTQKVFIIDMVGGYMHSRLPDNCQFIPYNHPEMLPPDTIVITQSCPLWRIPFVEKFDRGTRVFFWNLHPDNLNPNIVRDKSGFKGLVRKFLNQFDFLRKKKLKKQVEKLIEKKSIRFMDMENLNRTEKILGLDIEHDLLLPLINSINIPERIQNFSVSKNDEVQCIWIGRIEGFKLEILLYTITQMELYNKHRIHLTIVGDGDDKNQVDILLNQCKNISYTCTGNLQIHELTDVLKGKHLAFCMGTSALDSASIGIPTVCLDYSHSKIKKFYQFRFLYQNSGYRVGSEIISKDFYADSCNLQNIFNEIFQDGDNVSKKCFEYCLNNHSHRIADDIPEIISNSTLTIGELLDENYFDTDIITDLFVKLLRREKVDSSGFILF